MHLGRIYPYQNDRWAVPTIFWPAFVPFKIILPHSALPAQWIELLTFYELSNVGIISPDRNSIRYDLINDGTAPIFNAWVTAFNAGATPDARRVGYQLDLVVDFGVDFWRQAKALLPYTFTRTTPFPDYWTESFDMVTGDPIPPPGSKPRFATYDDL